MYLPGFYLFKEIYVCLKSMTWQLLKKKAFSWVLLTVSESLVMVGGIVAHRRYDAEVLHANLQAAGRE